MTKSRTESSRSSRPAKRRATSRAAAAKEAKVVSPKLPLAKLNRAERAAERRAAIIEAALDEFTARGFAATRLDDIAKRAGVAKGTIYLYFRDKESLFQELVRAMLSPVVSRVVGAPMIDLPARMGVEGIADMFVREVFG